ncbi:hypothetical protein ACH4SP_28240 [Streptomyces sp. NPDC021093]|uniref:hypothetical protein n=1 Tax=Streptomyces sp. NPDC021093 TaxID=3365112 RepID=UPI0037AC4FED
MNALTTALRVLRWAVDGTGPPPGGPLQHTAALIDPGADVHRALAELIRRFAAQHGAGRPPFGDPEPAGAGGVLLAAAIGGRMDPDSACAVAEALPPPALSVRDGGWCDALARHAVVAPFLDALPRLPGATPQGAAGTGRATAETYERRISEVLLDASPLTAVLHHPASGPLSRGATGAVRTAGALVRRPGGHRFLCHALADWPGRAPVLDWRSQLLARLSADHPEVVLDTCLTARLRYGAEWDLRIREARRQLALRSLPDDLTLATVRFWAPLADLARRHSGLAAARPLLTGHQPAVGLVRRYRLTPSATG